MIGGFIPRGAVRFTQGQEMLKSSLLLLILSTSGAKAGKRSNRAFGAHFVDFWCQGDGRLLVPSGFKAVLLTLFMVSQYDTTIPLMFARGKRKRQIFPADATDKERSEAIEDLFLHGDLHTLTNLAAPTTVEQAKHLQKCWRLYTELQVVGWVTKMNFERGVAPSTNKILAQLNAAAAQGSSTADDIPQRHVSENKDRQWASRWRRRHSGKIKKMKTY